MAKGSRDNSFGKMTAKRLASGKAATKQEIYEELSSRNRGRNYLGVIPDSVGNYVGPTLVGLGSGAMIGNQAGELYRAAQSGNISPRDGLLAYAGPDLLGAAAGMALGIRSGHWKNQRAKQVRKRLEDNSDEELKDMLGARHKKLLESKTPPNPDQIRKEREERAAELEVKRRALEEYRANKVANLVAPPQTSKQDIYDELVTRRVEAKGDSLTKHKLKNFGRDYKAAGSQFFDSMKLPAALATGASALHEYNQSKKKPGYKPSIPRILGPGAIALTTSNMVGLAGGAAGMIRRSKKSYGMSAYSTEELESMLPKNKLRQLYAEHGSEGEEFDDQ